MAAVVDESKDDIKEDGGNLSGQPETTVFKYPDQELSERWKDLRTILTRPSAKLAPPPFDPEGENMEALMEDFRVLVVGAGGLGCELLKNLALSGIKDIEVIDLDIIDLSNLNRQFLFRKKDIGQPKAKIAAKFVMERVAGCTIRWYQKPLQDFDAAFYSKFNVVIAGLDNVEARRWLNAMLVDLVRFDDSGAIDPESIIPFIDGGTEGFKGQCRLFVPRCSACFECSIGTLTPPKVFQSCTIASIPRRPEHCIAYAHKMLWPRLISLETASKYEMADIADKNVPDPNGVKLDKDDVEHMSWIYNRALERAEKFKIQGVTFHHTMQVVKNIIPAIASTNALVSALCVNEAIKVLTWCSFGLNNYFMFMGQDGVYSRTWPYPKNPQCPVCGSEPVEYRLDPATTFDTFYKKLLNDENLKLKNPSVSTSSGTALFMAGKALRALYHENLAKAISELFESGTMLNVSDPKVLGRGNAKINVVFEEGAIYVPPVENDGGAPTAADSKPPAEEEENGGAE